MQEAVSLTCPNCGSKLRIAEHVVRFACAGCGAGLILEREGGIVFLTLVEEDRGDFVQEVDDTRYPSTVDHIKQEIKAIHDNLWTQKEGIPIDTIFNFFVMVDDLAYKRLGQKRKKGFFGIPMGPQLGEEDIKRVLYSLTNEEIDFMIHSCIELTEKGTPMQHYRRQLEQIKRLQRDLALAQRNS